MPSTLWRWAILRGHGTGVKQRPSLATRTWWWWWWWWWFCALLDGVCLSRNKRITYLLTCCLRRPLLFSTASEALLRPTSIHACLLAGHWYRWSNTSLFGWTSWHAGSSNHDSTQSADFPCRRSPLSVNSAYISHGPLRDGWKIHLLLGPRHEPLRTLIV